MDTDTPSHSYLPYLNARACCLFQGLSMPTWSLGLLYSCNNVDKLWLMTAKWTWMGAEIIGVAEGILLFVRTASETLMRVVLGVQSHGGRCCRLFAMLVWRELLSTEASGCWLAQTRISSDLFFQLRSWRREHVVASLHFAHCLRRFIFVAIVY
jgi:hypothetical protein